MLLCIPLLPHREEMIVQCQGVRKHGVMMLLCLLHFPGPPSCNMRANTFPNGHRHLHAATARAVGAVQQPEASVAVQGTHCATLALRPQHPAGIQQQPSPWCLLREGGAGAGDTLHTPRSTARRWQTHFRLSLSTCLLSLSRQRDSVMALSPEPRPVAISPLAYGSCNVPGRHCLCVGLPF